MECPANPTTELATANCPSACTHFTFVIPHIVRCEEVREGGLTGHKGEQEIGMEGVLECGATVGLRRSGRNDLGREAQRSLAASDTTSLSDSDETWLPDTDTSPNSSEYLIDRSYFSGSVPFHAEELKE